MWFFYTFVFMEHETQIFGLHSVIEAIQAGKTIEKIFIQKGLQGNLANDLESLIRKRGYKCILCSC